MTATFQIGNQTGTQAWFNIGSATTTTANITFTQLTNTLTVQNQPMTGLVTAPLVDGRRLPPLEFNPYINASDLLEEFIRYAGEQGARQDDVLSLPIELFVKWLIIRACEQDQEEPNVTLELPAPRKQLRCLGCQRYMRHDTTLPLHGRRCAAHLYARTERLVAA